MKFTSIFLLTLVALGYTSAANQAASSIPPAGEAVTPTLNNAPKSNVEGKTFFLIAHILGSVCKFLFGDHKKGSHDGIVGYNGSNQYYGTVNNYYTIYSPNIRYVNNGDGTHTLNIYGINGVQNASTVQLTCPANTFKINKSGNGYLCQLYQDASCNVRYA